MSNKNFKKMVMTSEEEQVELKFFSYHGYGVHLEAFANYSFIQTDQLLTQACLFFHDNYHDVDCAILSPIVGHLLLLVH